MSDSQTLSATSVGQSSQGANVLRAAGLMGLATFFSRILGLVREQVIAILFGAGNATDAFNVAFRIPNLLRDLFAEGAMSASLVPTFTRTRIEEGDRRAWRVAGLVFRVLLVIVTVLAALGILFADQLVSLYASAFKNIPGKYELTVEMTRILFPFFPLVALAAAFMGILNSCGIFFIPAFSSALFNLASVLFGVVFVKVVLPWTGWTMPPIEGMALGVLVGGAAQALCQLPALYRAGYRWQKKDAHDLSWFQDPALKRMLWMMVPGTIGLAATQVNILMNTILATSQGPGAVSWLSYSFRLMQFPIGVFGVSLGSATLPRISALWVQQDLEGVGNTLNKSLRQVFAINLPAAAGLGFLGYPIIELIFQYGRFYSDDTRQTALALAMYAIGLPAYSSVKVLVPACYAFGNTRIPVISSFVAVGATIVLNLLMVKKFGYWGLALGTSAGAMINFFFLLFSVRSLIGSKKGKFRLLPLATAFLKQSVLALLMGAACYYSYSLLNDTLPDRFFIEIIEKSGMALSKAILPLTRGIKVGIVIFEGVGVVMLLAHIFRLEETTETIQLFSQKLKKKLSRKVNSVI